MAKTLLLVEVVLPEPVGEMVAEVEDALRCIRFIDV
jgi:hypothetical protein